ncbi:MAG: hypothetical protein KAI21_08965, partial [Deltaproteobacteria bacterium]|nr:hypothetical protein [Deltaproteobacteria bacterium]
LEAEPEAGRCVDNPPVEYGSNLYGYEFDHGGVLYVVLDSDQIESKDSEIRFRAWFRILKKKEGRALLPNPKEYKPIV